MRGFRLRYSFYSDPREKKKVLDQSALTFIAPSQSQERLKRFGPDFGHEGWLAPNAKGL